MERNKKTKRTNTEFDERRSIKPPKAKKIPKRMAYDPDEFESFEEMMDYRTDTDDEDLDEFDDYEDDEDDDDYYDDDDDDDYEDEDDEDYYEDEDEDY